MAEPLRTLETPEGKTLAYAVWGDPAGFPEFAWAEAGEEVLNRELEREDAEMRERVAADPSNVLEGFELSESDRAELARPEVMQVIREATTSCRCRTTPSTSSCAPLRRCMCATSTAPSASWHGSCGGAGTSSCPTGAV